MKMPQIACASFLALTLIVLSIPSSGQDTMPDDPYVDSIKIVKDRELLIKNLLLIVNDQSSSKLFNGSLNRAIFSLGEIRSTESVASLAKNLSFLPEVKSGQRVSISPLLTEEYYPSAAALIKIGEPSDITPQLIKKISSSDNEIDWALSSWVLISLYGKASAIQH